MNNIWPITGKNCSCAKNYKITYICNKKVNEINVCLDCLCNLDNYDAKSKVEDCCGFCGMTLEELLRNSKMGCANCYIKFEKPFVFSLEKLQKIPNKTKNEIKHVGKAPYLWKKQQAENTDPIKFLLELKQKLSISVKHDNYKKAQDLKNKIFAFESYLKKIDEFKHDDQQVNLIKKEMFEFIYMFRESESEEN